MALFFFHLTECGSVTEDWEGREFPDLHAARIQAVASARDIMAHEILEGELCLSCHIDIAAESGEIFDRVVFSDAITVSGREDSVAGRQ